MKLQVRKQAMFCYDWVLVAANNRVIATSVTIWCFLKEARNAARIHARTMNIRYDKGSMNIQDDKELTK